MKKVFFFVLLLVFFVSTSLARLIGEFEIPPKKVAESKFSDFAKSSANRITTTPLAGEIWRESSTGMEFVWVQGGCFEMGSSHGNSDEKPVHKVCVDGFWMGRYEVTQGQWKNIMDCNPSHFKKGDNYPVEQVSWNDCQMFIGELKARSGKGFRLPTEAEWEYACRSGERGEKYSGGNVVDRVAWYILNSNSSSHIVGGKAVNGFDLYDMVGNVWEWTADWYDGDYYKIASVCNYEGPSSGIERVFRGGGWNSGLWYLRSANRFHSEPEKRDYSLGFRLVSTGSHNL